MRMRKRKGRPCEATERATILIGARGREHRLVLLLWAGFSWWPALQGFGPGIATAFSEVGLNPKA